MLSPLSDVLANITLAHCDAVGRGHPLHQFSAQINTLAFPTCEAAARFAFMLDELRRSHRPRFRGRIICDYGAAKDRAGRIDDNLLARLAAGVDFPSFPDEGVLAAPPFARELQFAGASGVRAISLGQRLSHVGSSDRIKVSAGQLVYRLTRS